MNELFKISMWSHMDWRTFKNRKFSTLFSLGITVILILSFFAIKMVECGRHFCRLGVFNVEEPKIDDT